MLVSFGNCSIYAIYPCLMPILRLILDQISTGTYDSFQQFNNDTLLCCVFMFSSEIIVSAVYLLIVIYIRAKKKKEKAKKEKRESVTYPTIAYVLTQKRVKYTNKYLLLVLLLAFIDYTLVCIIYALGSTQYIYLANSLQIVFYSILSLKILSYPIYAHHYLSMGIIIIGVFLVHIQKKIDISEWYYGLTIFGLGCFSGVQVVSEKWLMDLKGFSPFVILLFVGAFGLAISGTVLLISEFTCTVKWLCQYKLELKNFGIEHFYYAMIYIAIVGLFNGCKFLTNKHYSPTHLIIVELLSAFLVWTLTSIIEKRLEVYPFVGYAIMAIGVLMYNELLIFHCWRLDYYTRQSIQNRSEEEVSISKQFHIGLFD